MFLGLDLGTSGLRGVLIDEDQIVLAVSEAAYDTQRPYPGWSEQDPHAWIRACRAVIRDLVSQNPTAMGALAGLAVSGHMHGAVLLDNQGGVLRPCIMWNDTRSAREAATLDAQSEVRTLSGNIVFPGFTAPKLAWVARHEPDIFSRIDKVVLPKDFLTRWLTGHVFSDMSDASGTAWLDVANRDWSTALLEAGQLRLDHMPHAVEGTAAIGSVRQELASEMGLPNTVTVAAGAADNAAAACGIGALNEGDGFVSLGTSGVLLAARERCAPSPETAVHTFCHPVPARWIQMGVILAATDSLNWLAGVLQSDAATLTGALGPQISGPGTLQFLPYLSGERTPHNDAAIRGAFVGLDISTERDDMTRAVLEGVSFALRDSAEALAETGARLERVTAIGGGAQSRYWIELLATVLNMPLDLPARGEFGAALGAARLAICAVTGAAPEAVMTRPDIAETLHPRADLVGAYATRYNEFRALYPALKA